MSGYRNRTNHLRSIFESKRTFCTNPRGEFIALIHISVLNLPRRVHAAKPWGPGISHQAPGTLLAHHASPSPERAPPGLFLLQHLFIFPHSTAAGRQISPQKSLPCWQAAGGGSQGPHSSAHQGNSSQLQPESVQLRSAPHTCAPQLCTKQIKNKIIQWLLSKEFSISTGCICLFLMQKWRNIPASLHKLSADN